MIQFRNFIVAAIGFALVAPSSAYSEITQVQLAFSDLSTLPAHSQECDVGAGNSKCPGEAVGPQALNDNPNYTAGYVASRTMLASQATVAIDAFGLCYYVDNNSSDALFVPYRSQPEWFSFIGNHPNNVSLVNCSRGGLVQIPANFGTDLRSNQCTSTPAPKFVTAPYALWTATAPASFNTNAVFTSCQSADGTVFSETAIATFTGFNSNANPVTIPVNLSTPLTLPPGWNLTTVTYKYDGQCGTATTAAVSATAPTTNLCHVGVATAPVLVNGQWQWSCQGGTGGGAVAACTSGQIANQPISIAFTANPTTILSGESSTLTWKVSNATACLASGDPLNQWTGSVSYTDGTKAVTPAKTTTYVLTCTNKAGESATASATVTVTSNLCAAHGFNGSLVVLFDDSGSIRVSDFIAARNFMNQFLHDLNFGPDARFQLQEFSIYFDFYRYTYVKGQANYVNPETYVSPILYTSPVYTRDTIDLGLNVTPMSADSRYCTLYPRTDPAKDFGCRNQLVNSKDAVSMINTLQNYGGDTDIYGAITRVTTSLQNIGGGPQIILLLTDGHQSEEVTKSGVPEASVAANYAKANGIRVMSVGIQDLFYDLPALKAMTANQTGNNLFIVPDYNSLNGVLKQLEPELCGGSN